jgi:cytochrome c5
MRRSSMGKLQAGNAALLAICGGLLWGCSQGGSGGTATPVAAPAPPPPPVVENTLGKSTYGKVCALCHAAGIGGAPKPGDKADWGPRIAQGMEVLYQHSLQGFTGTKGVMPPHGAVPTLTDEEMKAAVDYMVEQSC